MSLGPKTLSGPSFHPWHQDAQTPCPELLSHEQTATSEQEQETLSPGSTSLRQCLPSLPPGVFPNLALGSTPSLFDPSVLCPWRKRVWVSVTFLFYITAL